MSISGIVANWCNVPRYSAPNVGVQDMFYHKEAEKQKHKRVGITRTEDDEWIFKTWTDSDSQEKSLLSADSHGDEPVEVSDAPTSQNRGSTEDLPYPIQRPRPVHLRRMRKRWMG
jgi:hypothetical protein